MTVTTRFDIEDQITARLNDREICWWNERTDTVKRAICLAAGFMDIEVIVRVIQELEGAYQP